MTKSLGGGVLEVYSRCSLPRGNALLLLLNYLTLFQSFNSSIAMKRPKALAILVNIAYQTLLFVSVSLAMDMKQGTLLLGREQ